MGVLLDINLHEGTKEQVLVFSMKKILDYLLSK
jgi:hypothetical protein